MLLKNDDIAGVRLEVPEGHRHLRATLTLKDGSEITMQEATVANLVRAYVSIKTHPTRKAVVMRGREMEDSKEGYANWQLLEVDDENI